MKKKILNLHIFRDYQRNCTVIVLTAWKWRVAKWRYEGLTGHIERDY
jgi:hypothetical protein